MLNIELRITVEENLTLGNGSLVIVSNDQTSLYQVFQSNLTSQTFSIQLVNDGAVNKTIKVNGSTTGSSNSYFTLRDATFIYELCDSNCLTCFGSATSCTSCGLDPFTYAQLYLEQVSGTCVLFCSSNYLMSHPTYECDTCHTACLICFAASSNSSCLTCNNSGGYYVKSNNLTTTCALGCLSS